MSWFLWVSDHGVAWLGVWLRVSQKILALDLLSTQGPTRKDRLTTSSTWLLAGLRTLMAIGSRH